MALEGEWETFASPFLLLAGAEVLNAGLEHLRTPLPLPDKSNKNHTKTTGTLSSQAASLTGLYQRVKQDLLRTQDVLCEPFLRSAADPPHASRTAPFATSANTVPHIYFQTANSLASSIQRIVLFLDVRCQLVDLQAALFHVGRGATAGAATDGIAVDKEVEATSVPSLTEAAVAVTLFLQTVTTATANSFGTNDRDLFAASNNMDDDDTKEAEPTDSLAVEPILNNLILELKAWKYCFETCVALEQSQ